MGELAYELNRLAGTENLDAAGAANAWGETDNLELVGAINHLAHTTNLELNGAIKALAFLFDGDPTLDVFNALDSAVKFTLYPLLLLYPDVDVYPGVG